MELVVDREKAAALGVTFEEINNAISTNLVSALLTSTTFPIADACSASSWRPTVMPACSPIKS
jgi:hypothetical protein